MPLRTILELVFLGMYVCYIECMFVTSMIGVPHILFGRDFLIVILYGIVIYGLDSFINLLESKLKLLMRFLYILRV